MRIIRKPRESIAGVREALAKASIVDIALAFREAEAKAYNDGWMNGFEAGKEKGRDEASSFPQRKWVQYGNHYVGKHIDIKNNVFHIYSEDSPLIFPGQPNYYMHSRGESSLSYFSIVSQIEIVHNMIGMRARNTDLPSDDAQAFDTAYFIPYREDGFLR